MRLTETIACLLIFNLAYAAEIVAHRGASSSAPENTVAATVLAWEQGAHGVECDIQLTKDGHAVLMHDKTTKRTTGVEGKVATMTLEELQALDAGSWKNKAFAGERIPTLQDVLATVPKGRRLVVELKAGKELIPGIAAALESTKLEASQIEFIAFDYATIVAVKERFSAHRALWLLGKPKKYNENSLTQAIDKCKQGKLDGMSISKDWPIDVAFVKTVKDAGLDLYVWTVNDIAEAKRLKDAGVPTICTDKPKEFCEELSVQK